MPFVPDDEKDKEQNQQGNVQISGASPTTDSEGTETKQSPGKELNTGSGYQNLDKYLQANASQNFGGQVVGKVQGDVDKVQGNIGKAADSFSNKVQSANQLASSDDINKAIANPAGTNAQQFQTWQNQSYKGPTSVSGEDYNQLWGGTRDAATKAGYLSTEPGRFTLLDSYFGKPTYNQGQKGLDNLLIQNQGGLGSQIKGVQSQANQLGATAQAQQDALGNQASTRAKDVQDNSQQVRNAIGVDASGNVIQDANAAGYGAIGKQYSDVQNQVAQQNAARQAEISGFKSDVAQGHLNQDELSRLGLSAGQNLYNVDLNNYLNYGADLNRNQVMSPDQRAYIQALSQLSGVTDTFAQGSPEDKTATYGIDLNRFNNDVGAAKTAYTAQSDSLGRQLSDAQKIYDRDLGLQSNYTAQLGAKTNQSQPGVTISNIGTSNAEGNARGVLENLQSQNNKELAQYQQMIKDIQGQQGDLTRKYTPTRTL